MCHPVIKTIYENKNLILMSEIGAYLHDLGKLDQNFIDSHLKNPSVKFDHWLILKRNMKIQELKSELGSELKKNIKKEDNIKVDLDQELVDILDKPRNELFIRDVAFKTISDSSIDELKKNIYRDLNELINKRPVTNKEKEDEKRNAQNAFDNFIVRNKILLSPINHNEIVILIKKLNELKYSEDIIKTIVIRVLKNNRKQYLLRINNINDLFTNNSKEKNLNILKKGIFYDGIFFKYLCDLQFSIDEILIILEKNCVNESINLGEFIEKHHDDDEKVRIAWLIEKLLKGSDNIDSGIDKGNAKNCQDIMHISNAFGYEKKLEDLEEIKKKCYEEIKKAFNKTDVSVIRETLFSEIQKYFKKGLGETRRSANDVTLEDHSFSVATLFKVALIERLVKSDFEVDRKAYDVNDNKTLKWKIMGISWNGLEFISRSIKVQQILRRKKIIDDIKEELKQFIEIDFPFGNCIYEDEDGIFFLVPALYYNTSQEGKDIKKHIEEKVKEIFSKQTEDEIIPAISFQEQPTRTLTSLVEERKNGLKKVMSSYLSDIPLKWIEEWKKNNGSNRDICPACRLRPRDMKNRIENPEGECDICNGLKQNRSKKWLKDINSKKDTIWLGEVSDKNNQVALLTGRFNLDNWLNGTYFPTVFSSSLIEWFRGVGQNHGDKDNYITNKYNLNVNNKSYYDIACELLQDSINNNDIDKLKIFFSQDGAKGIREFDTEINILNSREIGEWGCSGNTDHILNLILRKHPSPARLRRIWKTTSEFSKFITGEIFLKDLLKEEINLRNMRLKFELNEALPEDFIDKNFEIELNGKFIEVYYHNEYKTLYTVDNLSKYLSAKKIEEITKLSNTILKSDSGKKINININKVDVLADCYLPYIPILSSPVTFQFIVPADKALDIIERIKDRYDKEFGKVKNRLPLHIGAIFFKQKTPLYIAIDASRRMLKNWIEYGKDDRKKTWEVKEKVDINHNTALKLEEKGTERNFELNVSWKTVDRQDDYYPYLTFDKNGKEDDYYPHLTFDRNGKEDYYYPYFFVNRNGDNFSDSKTFSKVPVMEGNYKNIIHVSEIQKEDTVELEPSYFDFEFLDSTIRRYDIVKPRKHFICGNNGPRPYFLEELKQIIDMWNIISSKNITQTQRKNFQSLLITKMNEWQSGSFNFKKDPNYKIFVENTIKNIFKKLDSNEQETLVASCRSGMIFDVLELFERLK